jgi:hypothetical protein
MSGYENSLLNLYFRENAQLRQAEITRIRGKVTDIIKRLAVLCHEADPRFSDEADFVGSFWQGLKVGEPDEFDVNIPFDLGPLLVTNQTPIHTSFWVTRSDSGYDRICFDAYRVMDVPMYANRLPDAPVNKVYAISQSPYAVRGVSHDGVVVPALVRQHFRTILMQALSDLHYPGMFNLMKLLNFVSLQSLKDYLSCMHVVHTLRRNVKELKYSLVIQYYCFNTTED